MGEISARFVPEHAATVFEANGAIDAHEIIAAIDKQYCEKPTPNMIWDFRGAGVGGLTPSEISNIARVAGKYLDARGDAQTIFVAKPQFQKVLAKLYREIAQNLGYSFGFQVTETLEQAFDWLAGGSSGPEEN